MTSGLRIPTKERGELLFTPPSDQARLTDFLNQKSKFFRVWTADSLYIVNKEHVMRLVEIANKDI